MSGFTGILAAIALAQTEPAPAPASADRAPASAAQPSPPSTPPSPPVTAPPSPTAPPPQPPTATARSPSPSTPRPAIERPAPADPERTQVAKAALAFLDALVAGDADAVAALSTERFSFDGDVRTGREAIRTTWRGLLAGRPHAALLDLEIVPAADAVTRLGPPPARIASLATRGGWVGIADVSGRAVILFLVRDGGRWAVAGLHD